MRALALRAIRAPDPGVLARGTSSHVARHVPKLFAIALATSLICLGAGAVRAEPEHLRSYPGELGDVGPRGNLARGPDGTLYFTTYALGHRGWGSVEALVPPTTPGGPWWPSRLFSFGETSGNSFPKTGVTLGPDGEIYGTTSSGGSGNLGTVFRLNPPAAPGEPWTKDTLHEFGSRVGHTPLNNLTLGPDGVLYGTTDRVARSGCGLAFRLKPRADGSPPWAFKVLKRFTPSFGCTPSSALVRDAEGNLYGSLFDGGPVDTGAIYKLAPQPDGDYRLVRLESFGAGLGNPVGDLTMDDGGALIGAVRSGGAYRCGAVYRLSPPATGQGRWRTKTIQSSRNGFKIGCHPVGVARNGEGFAVLTRQGTGPDGVGGGLYDLTPRRADLSRYVSRLRESFDGISGEVRGTPVVGPDGDVYGYTAGRITIWRSAP